MISSSSSSNSKPGNLFSRFFRRSKSPSENTTSDSHVKSLQQHRLLSPVSITSIDIFPDDNHEDYYNRDQHDDVFFDAKDTNEGFFSLNHDRGLHQVEEVIEEEVIEEEEDWFGFHSFPQLGPIEEIVDNEQDNLSLFYLQNVEPHGNSSFWPIDSAAPTPLENFKDVKSFGSVDPAAPEVLSQDIDYILAEQPVKSPSPKRSFQPVFRMEDESTMEIGQMNEQTSSDIQVQAATKHLTNVNESIEEKENNCHVDTMKEYRQQTLTSPLRVITNNLEETNLHSTRSADEDVWKTPEGHDDRVEINHQIVNQEEETINQAPTSLKGYESNYQDVPADPWINGRRVKIIAGKGKGEYGIVAGKYGSQFVWIALDFVAGEQKKKKTCLELIPEESSSTINEADQDKIIQDQDKIIQEAGSSDRNLLRKDTSLHQMESENVKKHQASPSISSSPASMASRTKGPLVRIIGKDPKLQGKVGSVIGKDRHYYIIDIPGFGEHRKTKKTLEFLQDVDFDSINTNPAISNTPSGSIASSIQRVAASLSRRMTPVSRSTRRCSQATDSEALHKWKVADSHKGGKHIGTRRIVKIRTQSEEDKSEMTFLSYMFQTRIIIEEIALNKREVKKSPLSSFEFCGSHFELILAKVYADGDCQGPPHLTQKCIRIAHAEISGPNLERISLEDELMSLANFAEIQNPRKRMARLELLLSPIYKHPKKPNIFGIFSMDPSDFCEIPAPGIDGCGFIDDALIVEMLGNNTKAERAFAIQVRIIIPSMGIYKGMLVRKRITSGPRIQLVSSMQKVGPSPNTSKHGMACLMITKNGVHPNSTNEHVGRLGTTKPPPKSFKIKPLSDMITRLWTGLEVPSKTCKEYSKRSVQREHLRHAWVVGLADPTGKIPPGHVFIPGMKYHQIVRDMIFVTRSPCLLPTDGRLCPLVSTKPESMSQNEWDEINNLEFGSIIFATPKEGTVPLPEVIAGGDLDGDLYCICWSPDILDSIKVEPIEEKLIDLHEEDSKESIMNEDWLEETQNMAKLLMCNVDINHLTGKLYNLSKKMADKLSIHDKDAIAFGEAYKNALDYQKHGGQIYLPIHLHLKVPQNLRQYLSCDTS